DAWTLGYLGPRAYPGALRRAAEQSFGRRHAAAVARHKGFVRLLVSAGAGAPAPAGDPVDDLLALTRAARAVLALPGALAWFEPAGEALRDAAFIGRHLDAHAAGGPPPLPIWWNSRVAALRDLPGWSLVDLVGLDQVGLPDLEACFPTGFRD